MNPEETCPMSVNNFHYEQCIKLGVVLISAPVILHYDHEPKEPLFH